MNGIGQSVQWVWAFSVVGQLAVCAFLFLKGHFRQLPIFTSYIVLNLCQAGLLYGVYAYLGFRSHSHAVLLVAWSSETVTLVTRALATTEILLVVLGTYRGVWSLAWRLIAVASTVVVGLVAIEARGNMAWALAEADRAFHLVFALAVIGCLLMVRYYSVPIAPTYKALLGGFCFYSCAAILVNTVLEKVLYPHNVKYEPIWQFATVLSYAVVQVVWAAALRKPIVAKSAEPFLFPAEIYRQLSPEINQNLRRLNEQLIRFWKPEAFRQ